MKKKKSAGSAIINVILVLVLLTGLSLLLYPTFSDYWNSYRQSTAITDYSHIVEKLDQETYERLWEEAESFNQSIQKRNNVYVLSGEEENAYNNALSIDGSRIMAYIDIPCIDCYLPIYHGTSDSVLQIAVGHVDWSSLPVGGEGTHCVLSGHRGLPSARLFTDLDELKEGDLFFITVFDKKLAYEVDQISVVLPEEVADLKIEEGKDYVTLVTCTPYGVNTHRLLVRGHRIEYTEPEAEKTAEPSEAVVINENLSQKFWMTAAVAVGGSGLLLLLLMLLFGRKKKENKNENQDDKE